MARQLPTRDEDVFATNTAVLLREAFVALNGLVVPRLAERGFPDVRPAHNVVFQYLDGAGTTVSTLAERAEMTKQAMGELVAHLEERGYVDRVPDPADRRAKLVRPTAKGRDVYRVVRELIPEIEQQVVELIGATRMRQLRRDLQTIRETFGAPG
ncbi:MAG TPA: MarR family transcriptional regulator [Lapillicoccus sp.]|nr:MarR family transcriptional regulator [Lapillicoccus sp.]